MTDMPSLSPLSGWRLYLAMTRPGFLSITGVGCLIGFASAFASGGRFNLPLAMATMALALLAHASANVLNDYCDSKNGADQANSQGIFPFTGGSRLIQKGVVSQTSTGLWALVLVCLVVPAGLLLALKAGNGLVTIGLIGLLLGWAYSAPPLSLMSRGFGELTVAVEWWLVVVGADYVQRGHLMVSPMFTGVGYALLVANILLVNGLPDAQSDASVGKHTLATCLGHSGVALLYAGVVLVANLWLALGVWMQISPLTGLWALVALPLSGSAAWILVKAKPNSTHLKVPIVLTIVAANTHGLALAVGLALPRL